MYTYVSGLQSGNVVFCGERAEVEEILDDSNIATEMAYLL
jgi:uncharacterized protein (DUF1697 family)